MTDARALPRLDRARRSAAGVRRRAGVRHPPLLRKALARACRPLARQRLPLKHLRDDRRITAFIDLIGAGTPELLRAFAPIWRARGSSSEDAVAERVYVRLPHLGFSERVLVPGANRLGVIRVKGVEWTDWGNADRVFATIRRTGWRPRWLERLPLPVAG